MRKSTRIALINALIAGGLVFFGAFLSGTISFTGIIAAFAAATTTFLVNMKQFFENVRSKKGSISLGILNFYGA